MPNAKSASTHIHTLSFHVLWGHSIDVMTSPYPNPIPHTKRSAFLEDHSLRIISLFSHGDHIEYVFSF